MLNTRKIRLLALASFLIFLVIFMVRSNAGGANDVVADTINEPGIGLEGSGPAPIIGTDGMLKSPPSDKNLQIEDSSKISSKIDEIDEAKVKQLEDAKKQPVSASQKGAAAAAQAGDLTTEKGSQFDPEKEFKEILSMAPVIIFSKTYCPYSKNLKNLLKNDYEIMPQPLIVELDIHAHGKELQQFIGELSGRRTVPNLFIGGASRGGSDDMMDLHQKGTLLEKLQLWGGKNIQVRKVNAPSNS